MTELIFVDEKGKEQRRETKGPGRPPRGAVKQEDGNFIVHPVEEKFIPFYIEPDGTRTPKGRGRGRPGYEKITKGENAGHWMIAKTAKAKKTKQVEAPVSV